MISKIRKFIPRTLIPYLRNILFLVYDLKNRKVKPKTPIPPTSLIFKAIGTYSPQDFVIGGEKDFNRLKEALAESGKDIFSFSNILDFGCGAGRIIRWFYGCSKHNNIVGVDIDQKAILWARKNLPFASFYVNNGLPSLPFQSHYFDLIYAVSVFTHLGEHHQHLWLKELNRVAKKGAFILITVHNEKAFHEARLPTNFIELFKRKGFCFYQSQAWKGLFPRYYGTSYHSKKYIIETWSKYFSILKISKFWWNQDLIIMRKE